jgi:hypothetical protein
MNNNKIRDLRAFVKYSALLTKYQSATHQLLSHYPFTGTFAGTFPVQKRGHRVIGLTVVIASIKIQNQTSFSE